MTNPLHVAALGADELARNQAFFRVGLTAMKGPRLVELDGFEAAAEVPVLGVRNYLMSRKARPTST